ncbi:MAG: prepilin peptidase [Fibrobacter sp.]|nr:prepilin peptidase [Fibrobacter sp.]
MTNFTKNYRQTAVRSIEKIPTGADAWVCKWVGKIKSRSSVRRRILKAAQQIYTLNEAYQKHTDQDLRAQILQSKNNLRGRIAPGQELAYFAIIQEAVTRTLGFKPYVEQMAGALALYSGYIAEMSTGEGKTVTAAMCAVLRGWTGYPCHVITANDYLAARDAGIMAPLFEFCGVSVGAVTGEMNPEQRKEGYGKDVTYSTAKEVLADYLRDRIALGKANGFSKRLIKSLQSEQKSRDSEIVQRGIFTAIVDEADNVLIDEAVTPLIISREKENQIFYDMCLEAFELAKNLQKDVDYEVDYKFRRINLYAMESENSNPFLQDLMRQALTARELFHLDTHYVIEDEKVVIVDESTGRKMPMRFWSDGLHQMVELKEALEVSHLKETEARMSFQRFFRLYQNFSGMTGTANEAAAEFWTIYRTPVIAIPNHKPCRRKVSRLRMYSTKQRKLNAILQEIQRVHALGRPILVGTKTIEESELLGAKIAELGLECHIINAVRDEAEASIVKNAGQAGTITVATNMAGRGTDIKISPEVASMGGLHVIATESNNSARIDRQLYGRAARQGEPGSAQHFASLEDELLKRYFPKCLRAFAWLNAKLSVKLAQYLAERKAYASRLAVQKTDVWLAESLGFSGDEL